MTFSRFMLKPMFQVGDIIYRKTFPKSKGLVLEVRERQHPDYHGPTAVYSILWMSGGFVNHGNDDPGLGSMGYVVFSRCEET